MAFKTSSVAQADGEGLGSLHGRLLFYSKNPRSSLKPERPGVLRLPRVFWGWLGWAENECFPLLSGLALCGGPRRHSPTGDVPGNRMPRGSFQRHSAGRAVLRSELPGIWHWGGFLHARWLAAVCCLTKAVIAAVISSCSWTSLTLSGRTPGRHS